jgi:hypothetical protein
MAQGRGSVEAYMDANPMQSWDRHKWDEYDLAIDTAFHGRDILFSPLMNYVSMPNGADTYHVAPEMLRGATNHNEIGLRQRYIDAIYADMRRKKLVSNKRYAGKAQVWEFDEINNRFSPGSRRWFLEVLRRRLMGGIVETHEKLARDSIFDFALHQFTADGTAFSAGTNDFSDIDTSSTYLVDVKLLEQVRLRMAERSMAYTQEWGTYASPVPNWGSDLLVLTTPNVIYDLWNTPEGQWMRDLRELQDQRIINGGIVRWHGITFAESMWARLWNAGTITKQVAVTSPINFGDGAPDPDETGVDNVYYVGQSGSNQVHHVQCSDLGSGSFSAGQRVSIHTARFAATDYGVANSVDFTDGETIEAEIYSVDEDNEQITFREPIPMEYVKPFSYTSLGADSTSGIAYAFITKAQDIHPMIVVGARGMATWAARTKVRLHEPEDHADLPGVSRVTWDEYGQMNRWNLDIFEILFCAASTAGGGGRGAVAVG